MIARLAVILAIASEALAVYVVAEWVAGAYPDGKKHAIDAIVFVGIALIAFALPRALQWLNLGRRTTMLAAGVVAYVALYGAIRIEFHDDFALWDLRWIVDFLQDATETMRGNGPLLVGAPLLFAVWVRSTLRSAEDVELEALPRQIGIPFIIVTVVLVLSIYADRTGEVARAGAAFYGAAVLALACSQLALSGATFGDVRAGGTTALLLGATAGLTIAAVVVFFLVFGIVGPVIGPPLGEAAGNVLFVVLYPVAWVIDHLVRLLLSAFGAPDVASIRSTLESAQEQDKGQEHTSTAAKAGGYLFRFIAITIALGVVSLVVVWFIRRRSPTRNTIDDSTAVHSGSLLEDGRALLNSLFHRGPRAPRGVLNPSEAQRLYLEVLARAEKAGVVRAPATTPGEFVPHLESAFHAPVTTDITAVFIEDRYAAREADAATVAELRRRWQDIR